MTEQGSQASIIIPVHNGAAYLDACLHSVLSDMHPDDQVIIVDDASTDESSKIVQSWGPAIFLVESIDNIGFAAACNLGATHADAPFLIFLNQDTKVLPGWRNALIHVLESADSSLALVSSQQFYLSQPEKIHNCGADLHYSGLIFLRDIRQPAGSGPALPRAVHSIVGASFAVRREIWAQLEGFAPELFMYYEEMDLSWRAELAGYRSCIVPASKVLHDVAFGSRLSGELYYICRNRHLSLLSNWRRPTLLLLLPGLLLAELAEFGLVVFAARMGGIRAKLAAYGWLIRNLETVAFMQRRRKPGRRTPDWVILQNRLWGLDPREFTGGNLGRALVQVFNIPLWLNGWLAWHLCHLLGW